jgi:uncharacterized OB-fold protein
VTEVRSKLDIQTASDPQQRDVDPWADFRQIEQISVELTQSYKHSLGKYSRFFIELENNRFMATHCESCGKTYAPPRPLCPDCLSITAWRELAGTGTLETWSVLHFGPGSNADVQSLETPYILAYVLMDGASTLFPHILKTPPETARAGMRVRVNYIEGPVEHPIHLIHFVPLED